MEPQLPSRIPSAWESDRLDRLFLNPPNRVEILSVIRARRRAGREAVGRSTGWTPHRPGAAEYRCATYVKAAIAGGAEFSGVNRRTKTKQKTIFTAAPRSDHPSGGSCSNRRARSRASSASCRRRSASPSAVDLADMDTIDALGKFVKDGWGKIDVLIANAGEFGPSGPIAELNPKDFEHTILLNFISTWRLIRAFDGSLRKAEAARALIVSSGATHAAQASWGAYPASKAACEALAHMWSNETKDLPLRVNLFDPGPTLTSIRDTIPNTAGKSSNLADPEDVARKALQAVAPNLDRTGQIFQAKFDRWVARQFPS